MSIINKNTNIENKLIICRFCLYFNYFILVKKFYNKLWRKKS